MCRDEHCVQRGRCHISSYLRGRALSGARRETPEAGSVQPRRRLRSPPVCIQNCKFTTRISWAARGPCRQVLLPQSQWWSTSLVLAMILSAGACNPPSSFDFSTVVCPASTVGQRLQYDLAVSSAPEGLLCSAFNQLRYCFGFILCWQDLLHQDAVVFGLSYRAPLLLVQLAPLRHLPPRPYTAHTLSAP